MHERICKVYHACQNTNRNFIGFELDRKYFEIAQERLGFYD